MSNPFMIVGTNLGDAGYMYSNNGEEETHVWDQ